jgi:bifunctional non-homologous end joining protein LigD
VVCYPHSIANARATEPAPPTSRLRPSHRRGCKITTVIRQHTPMAPTLVRAPFHRPGWIYEEKVDGYRMLAYKDGARVRLVSRNGVDHTRRY